MDYLRENTDLRLVDMKPYLLEAKEREQVYYRTDTHWNHIGAAIGFEKISEAIQQALPDKDIKLPSRFVDTPPYRGDLSIMIGYPDYDALNPKPRFSEPCDIQKLNYDAQRSQQAGTVCPTADMSALVFHDSFFEALKIYVSENFARAEFFKSNIQYDRISSQISEASPDLIIEQMVERRLINGIQIFPEFEADNTAERQEN